MRGVCTGRGHVILVKNAACINESILQGLPWLFKTFSFQDRNASLRHSCRWQARARPMGPLRFSSNLIADSRGKFLLKRRCFIKLVIWYVLAKIHSSEGIETRVTHYPAQNAFRKRSFHEDIAMISSWA